MAVIGNAGPFVVGEDCVITDVVTADGTLTGTPVDVSGWTGNFLLYNRQTDPGASIAALYSVAFTVPTGTDGKLVASLPHATTATLGDRAYWYEFRRTDSGANTVVRAGWVTFLGG